MKIAIIGAGICGCATAGLLSRAGLDVTLFDRFLSPKSIGAGILLQPVGLLALEKMDLLNQALEVGTKVHSMVGVNHYGKKVMDVSYRDLGTHSGNSLFGLGIHRGSLFHMLYERAKESGSSFVMDKDIRDIKTLDKPSCSAEDSYLLLSDSEEIGPFNAVIIANGTNSTLREQHFKGSRSTPYPWGALWAITDEIGEFDLEVLDQKYHSSHTMSGILPSGLNPNTGMQCASFFWSLPCLGYSKWREESIDHWKKKVTDFEPRYGKFLEQVSSHQDVTFAQYGDVVVKQHHHNSLLCVGDAAHGMSPQLGLGANLALIDALVLKECLQEFSDVRSAFSNYSLKRKKHINYYRFASKWLTPLFQSHSLSAGLARDAVFPLLNKVPFLYQEALRTIAGVKTGVLGDDSLFEL